MDHQTYKKVALIILDGFGVANAGRGNAISQAKIPNINTFISNYPSMTLQASGPLVGLPWGEMGNSEVGHLNIGAGRIVGQDLPRITAAIQSGEFFKNDVLLKAIEHSKTHGGALHVAGLISGGGVHSLDEHLYALLGMAAENGQRHVYVHMFTDGRDTDTKVALLDLQKFNQKVSRIGTGVIATMAGRFYAMDRGAHWNQTRLTYDAMVFGAGPTAPTPEACVQKSYDAQIFDETIIPTVITGTRSDKAQVLVGDGDAIVFFNFRSDRALQLTQMFVGSEAVPDAFRPEKIPNLFVATMTEYMPGLSGAEVVFKPFNLENNLAQLISQKGLSQFHIAESEKYAHVTIFFNCGRSEKFPGEDRVFIDSPNNAHNYSDQPEMSALKVTDQLVERIEKGDDSFVLANFANSDMVGHTGNLAAGIAAVSFLDVCLGRIYEACDKVGAVMIVTADHGNIEQMLNSKTGDINKDHTTSPVPFLVIGKEFAFAKPKNKTYTSLAAEVPAGVISDIAPTILKLLGMEKPMEMTGIDLLENL